MVERSLTDRVLALLEQDPPRSVSAALELAAEVEETQRRLDDLEEVVPPPPRWPTQQVRIVPPSQGGS